MFLPCISGITCYKRTFLGSRVWAEILVTVAGFYFQLFCHLPTPSSRAILAWCSPLFGSAGSRCVMQCHAMFFTVCTTEPGNKLHVCVRPQMYMQWLYSFMQEDYRSEGSEFIRKLFSSPAVIISWLSVCLYFSSISSETIVHHTL